MVSRSIITFPPKTGGKDVKIYPTRPEFFFSSPIKSSEFVITLRVLIVICCEQFVPKTMALEIGYFFADYARQTYLNLRERIVAIQKLKIIFYFSVRNDIYYTRGRSARTAVNIDIRQLKGEEKERLSRIVGHGILFMSIHRQFIGANEFTTRHEQCAPVVELVLNKNITTVSFCWLVRVDATEYVHVRVLQYRELCGMTYVWSALSNKLRPGPLIMRTGEKKTV